MANHVPVFGTAVLVLVALLGQRVLECRGRKRADPSGLLRLHCEQTRRHTLIGWTFGAYDAST